MTDFLSMVISMVEKSIKEHGLIKTCYALIGLALVFALCVFVWRLPDILAVLM